MRDWGYSNSDGPHTWCRCHPQAGGENQSPVNIDDSQAKFSPTLAAAPLQLQQPTLNDYKLSNTGASFMVEPEPCVLATASNGPLSSTYRLAQLHMHWGSSSSIGSEHTRNGRYYAAELHLVHYNSDKFSDPSEATGDRDGFTVLGAFVEIGAPNAALAQIISNFASIRQPGASRQVTNAPFEISQLMPSCTGRYFTYSGSLTTPPCTECVRWIVFDRPISASEQQMEQLRSLLGSNNQQLVNNFRSLVPLGIRELLSSFES